MTPNKLSALLIDQHLAQSSSGKCPPAVDGDKYRDPHLDNVQRVRDLGTLSPEWDGLVKTTLHTGAQGTLEKRRLKGFNSWWRWKTPRKQDLNTRPMTDI